MPKRLNYEFVRSKFEEVGYKLLTKYYVNCQQKLDYICSNNHTHSITYNGFKDGKRCFYCFGKKKKSLKFINDLLMSEGYKLLSTSYKDYRTKLKCECLDGHIFYTDWRHLQQGRRCSICSNSQAALKRSGSGHHNWKGGISCEPYCDAWADKEYKESIKERDNYKCQNPLCAGIIYRLSVHHIDYNKKNCRPENLITLCTSCNSKANFDREWYQSWYKILMYRRYGYEL